MGIFDALTGGGSQTVKAKLPGYVEDPSKQVGWGVNGLLQSQPAISGGQQGAINQAMGIANSGQASGYLPYANNFMTNLFGGTQGLNASQGWLAGQLTNGAFQNPALGGVQNIANGGDLGSNPFLSQMYSQAAQGVTDQLTKGLVPQADRNFAASGRLGSAAYANQRNTMEQQTGKALGDMATNMFGNAYQSDKANQMSALGMLSSLGQQDVNNRLQGAGLYQQGMQNQFAGLGLAPQLQQSNYADPTAAYQWATLAQQAPWQQYSNAANILGQLRTPQTQVQAQQMNPISQLIGWGTAIGSMGMGGGQQPGYGATGQGKMIVGPGGTMGGGV